MSMSICDRWPYRYRGWVIARNGGLLMADAPDFATNDRGIPIRGRSVHAGSRRLLIDMIDRIMDGPR